jgi:hypothetical protein
MDIPPQVPMPKKSCLINLMFAIEDDKEALAIKEQIDAAIAKIKDKRYTFQIVET